MNRIAIACLALLPVAVAAQTMYKWVDEKGVTHFSETPPPDGGKAAKITVNPTPPSAPVPPPPDYRQKELDARGMKVQKEQKEKQISQEEAQAQSLKKGRCLEAQRQVLVLAMQRPVFTTNAKGEKVYVEDEERQAQVKKWQDRVKEFCE
jgi:hypothetical protein